MGKLANILRWVNKKTSVKITFDTITGRILEVEVEGQKFKYDELDKIDKEYLNTVIKYGIIRW